ncbi:MAG: glycoside hydrolase family 3 N-terminal domain-containing protein [Candidatus Kapaibacterium sp.]
MKKTFLFLLLFFTLANTVTESNVNITYSKNFSWAEMRIKEMTLREKIAQMIITYSDGFYNGDNDNSFKRLKNLIENEKVGGIIFFKGRALEEAKLINKLQALSETPLLISQDFERGTAMRLEDGSLYPNNMGIGATRNPDLAYQMGLQIAKECRALGVHQNYSPVVDVNNNPLNPIINVRSFGEDPNLVSVMGDAMIRGLQDGKVIATAKHFPGHGDTDIDTHNDLPEINNDMKRMDAVELVPFVSAIKSGVKSVMVAHISFPALDKTPFIPATLSPEIVNGLLLEKLGFKGLVITDALNMDGVTKHFNTKEVAIRCVNAGIDLILMPQGETKTIDAIENAVNKGEISEERINISVNKILEAKEWLKLNENKYINEDDVLNQINNQDAQFLSKKIAEESITLVRNQNVLPLSKNNSNNKYLILSLYTGKEPDNAKYFYDGIYNKIKSINDNPVDIRIIDSDISSPEATYKDLSGYDYIIIPLFVKVKMKTGTVGMDNSHAEFIKQLTEVHGKKVVVISFGNPYLLSNFTNVSGYIAAYGDSKSVIDAAIKTIAGDINPKGKLPVTITDEYNFGFGLNYR